LSGAARTIRILNAANGFGVLTISGTITAASAITTAALLTVSGTFDTSATNYGLTIGGGVNGQRCDRDPSDECVDRFRCWKCRL